MEDMVKVATDGTTDVYITIPIHSIVYQEKDNKNSTIKERKLTPCYQPMLFRNFLTSFI